MSPKEKAEELYAKFAKATDNYKHTEIKDCALIAVDEILSLNIKTNNLPNNHHYFVKSFWIKVKEEIQSL